jgi:hypothetical protein
MWYRTRNEDKETKEALEKIEGAIKNGQSKDTDNMWYRTWNEDKETKETLEKIEGAIQRHRTKTKKRQNTAQKEKKDEQHGPQQKDGVQYSRSIPLGNKFSRIRTKFRNRATVFVCFCFFRLNLNMLKRKLVLNFSTWLSNK